VIGCPLEIIPAESWQVIEMAGLYKKGLAPTAGGVLQQARTFLAAARFVWADQARWRVRLKLDPE
jgi:hypothetical protein